MEFDDAAWFTPAHIMGGWGRKLHEPTVRKHAVTAWTEARKAYNAVKQQQLQLGMDLPPAAAARPQARPLQKRNRLSGNRLMRRSGTDAGTEETTMRQYTAFFDSKEHTFTASSLYEASQIAVKHFNVPRSKRGLLSVILSDVPIQHSNADFG
jgi:hypothetical protein